MSTFQTDPEAVAAAAAAARAAIDRTQADLASLTSQLQHLQSIWTGAASAAFQQAGTDWYAAQRAVEQRLTALATALNQAGQTYADAESANLRLFAG